MLTQKQLKEHLHYNPEKGMFTRIPTGVKAGGVTSHGYIAIRINCTRYPAHRLAFLYMEGEHPPHHVDHINHIKTDNRWNNLRHADSAVNGKNMSMSKKNTSGVTGVSRSFRARDWVATIKDGSSQKHLGYFDNLFDAVCARKSAEMRLGYHENHGR